MNVAGSGRSKTGEARGETGPQVIDTLEDESLRRVLAFAQRKRRISVLLIKLGLLLVLWSVAAATLTLVAMVLWQDIPAEELWYRVRLLLNR